MPRKLRLEYAGAIYHVISRGNRRERIFVDDRDRKMFLQVLEETCQRTGWQVHAYCLMSNHFHLVIETPRPNLSAGMQWLLSTYTLRFNRRHKSCGHVFSGRFKAPHVDGSGNGYLKVACDYVHLNPVRAGLLKAEERLKDYRWSSYPEYLKGTGKRKQWLRTDRLMGEWGIGKDNASGRRQFEASMEQRKAQEHILDGEDWKAMRRGWCIGGKKFREQLLDLLAEERCEEDAGEELYESEEQRAERIVVEMLCEARCKEPELEARRKNDPMKLRIAARLRTETAMSWKWIAKRLHMGHWRSAANAVRQKRKSD